MKRPEPKHYFKSGRFYSKKYHSELEKYADHLQVIVDNKINKNKQLITDLASKDEQIKELKGLENAWSLRDTLEKLIEASNILLNDKSYDGHGYEQIYTARDQALEYVKLLEG